jgi:hypothetical protein
MTNKRQDRINLYSRIIEQIFFSHYQEGATQIEFERQEIAHVAQQLGIPPPKNLGDVIYSFRYRAALPESIRSKVPVGQNWVIRSVGRSRYRFTATAVTIIAPNPLLAETKVPDATPGVIALYALSDEQALLAKLRYNRLVDIFTGVACYSLQSHLRTYVTGMGQVETDEVYVGVDRRGAHFVFPIQAKGGSDTLNIIQIEQDFAMCSEKFPNLICCAIASQFIAEDLIALFAFEQNDDGVAMTLEKHYRLVPPHALTEADLAAYRSQLTGDI